MILIDAGPLFALFSVSDPDHEACVAILKTIKTTLYTTIPVITEVCYLMRASHYSLLGLAEFIQRGAVCLWSMDNKAVEDALILAEKHLRYPIDFADASLIAAAEALKITQIFTLDQRDFIHFRIRKGYRYYPLQIITP